MRDVFHSGAKLQMVRRRAEKIFFNEKSKSLDIYLHTRVESVPAGRKGERSSYVPSSIHCLKSLLV